MPKKTAKKPKSLWAISRESKMRMKMGTMKRRRPVDESSDEEEQDSLSHAERRFRTRAAAAQAPQPVAKRQKKTEELSSQAKAPSNAPDRASWMGPKAIPAEDDSVDEAAATTSNKKKKKKKKTKKKDADAGGDASNPKAIITPAASDTVEVLDAGARKAAKKLAWKKKQQEQVMAKRLKKKEEAKEAKILEKKLKEKKRKKLEQKEREKDKQREKQKDENFEGRTGWKKTGGGVMYMDTTLGTGQPAVDRRRVKVAYVGSLTSGKVFDQGEIGFKLGKGDVIKGWDLGVAGMKVGGTRRLTIPPGAGYGNQRVSGIPPGSTLRFEVTLIDVAR